ncbi:alpha/beta hydrolase [bacterium]|nr:alpha/beta hydrolase [bacterium]
MSTNVESKSMSGKRKASTLAIVSLILVFVFMTIASSYNNSGGKVTIRDIHYPDRNGNLMHGQIYIPDGASAENPAPAILSTHGGSDYIQMVGNFALELSRRGYVVLAVDHYGSGSTDYATGNVAAGAGTGESYQDGGVTLGLEHLLSYDFVDKDNVGLTGHSVGGTFIAKAALANADKVKAIFPYASGSFFDMMKGTDPSLFTFNVGYTIGTYDEFLIFASGKKPVELFADDMVMEFFNTDQPIVPGQVYGSFADGTARVIYNPQTSHTENLTSKTTIGAVVEFFEEAMPSGTSLTAENQVWPLKELFSLLAIIALLTFAIGLASVLLKTEVFKPLTQTTKPQLTPINKWFVVVGVVISIVLPMLTYHKLGLRLTTLPSTQLFPMLWANYITWLSLINVAVLLVVFLVWYFVYGKNHRKGLEAYGLSVGGEKSESVLGQIVRALFLAIAVIFSVYFVVNFCYNIFKIDFRIGQFGIMPITLKRFGYIWPYMVSFIAVFGVINVLGYTLIGYSTEKKGKLGIFWQYALNWLIGVGGFALLLIIYLVILKITNYPPFFLPYPPFVNGHPNALVLSMKLVTMVPAFTFASILNTAINRKTKTIYAGWFTAAMFIAMLVVTTNAFTF